MIEAFERVLKRFIIPKFDRLYNVKVGMSNKGLVVVVYYSSDRIDYKDSFSIERETENFFRLVGFESENALVIFYKVDE